MTCFSDCPYGAAIYLSGSATGQRDGFEGLVAEVALGQVGIVLALEISRLAREAAGTVGRSSVSSAHGEDVPAARGSSADTNGRS